MQNFGSSAKNFSFDVIHLLLEESLTRSNSAFSATENTLLFCLWLVFCLVFGCGFFFLISALCNAALRTPGVLKWRNWSQRLFGTLQPGIHQTDRAPQTLWAYPHACSRMTSIIHELAVCFLGGLERTLTSEAISVSKLSAIPAARSEMPQTCGYTQWKRNKPGVWKVNDRRWEEEEKWKKKLLEAKPQRSRVGWLHSWDYAGAEEHRST